MNLPPPSDIFESLRYFRAHSLFCDVRLQYPDSLEFFVHRVVVAAASPFFRDRLTQQDGVQVIPMPVECPPSVAAFVLAWLYHEPTKLEISDEPENLEFLMKLKHGAEFLGIEELQSHVDVIVDSIHGVKREIDYDATSAAAPKLPQRQPVVDPRNWNHLLPYPPPSQPRRRGRPPKKSVAIVEKTEIPIAQRRLVVELKRIAKEDDDDEDSGEYAIMQKPAAALKDTGDDGVEDDTHDSGVGELPEDANGGTPGVADVVIKIEKDAEEGAEATEVVKKKKKPVVKRTVAKKPTTTMSSSSSSAKRKKRRKFSLTNPPCPIKRKEKILEARLKAKAERSNEMITCEYCGKSMKRGELTRHNHNVHRYHIWKKKNGPVNDPMLTEHLNERQFECKKCGFIIPREAKKFEREAAKHLYKTHNILCTSIGFACSYEGCTSVQWTKPRLNKHEKSHLTPRNRVKCPHCPKTLLESSLKAHIEDLHATKPFEHLCDLCGRGFASKSKVAAHERFAHYKKGVFHCDQCDDDKPFQTTNRESLLHHQYYLHGILPEGAALFSCELCDFKTPVKFNINRHMKRKHEPLTPYPCPECGKQFNRSSFLEAHITRVHRSGESHPCDECEAVFRSAAGLRYHRWKFHRTGSNGPQRDDPEHWFEKPFMCGYCSHTSGLAGNLKKHIVNMHKEMPVKVIDLRKARKEAKKAARAKKNQTTESGGDGGATNGVDGDGDESVDAVIGDASHVDEVDGAMMIEQGDSMVEDRERRREMSERMDDDRMRDMKDRVESETMKEFERMEMERMREMSERMDIERMREMSERMESGGVDMRRIDMIVNQIANRIHT